MIVRKVGAEGIGIAKIPELAKRADRTRPTRDQQLSAGKPAGWHLGRGPSRDRRAAHAPRGSSAGACRHSTAGGLRKAPYPGDEVPSASEVHREPDKPELNPLAAGQGHQALPAVRVRYREPRTSGVT